MDNGDSSPSEYESGDSEDGLNDEEDEIENENENEDEGDENESENGNDGDDENGESSAHCDDEQVIGKSDTKVPGAIKFKSEVFSIDFHPNKKVLASGEISGKISLYEYGIEKNKMLLSFKQHKKACRSLQFSSDGNKIYSCSKDKSIKVLDMNTGATLHDKQLAHQKAINCMKLLSDNYMASGSDDGVVKIWDTRTFSVIAEHNEQKDYISDITCSKDSKYLLTTSGDGYLAVYNARAKKMDGMSDQQDDELLSVQIIKNQEKVVCGSSDGTLAIFSWGQWGDLSDRIPSNNESIDTICNVTQDVICTGSSDGKIRALFVQPHRAIGIVGTHSALGVEQLKISTDEQTMASCSENTVKFWDVSHLHEQSFEQTKQKKQARKRKLETTNQESDFFADL